MRKNGEAKKNKNQNGKTMTVLMLTLKEPLESSYGLYTSSLNFCGMAKRVILAL